MQNPRWTLVCRWTPAKIANFGNPGMGRQTIAVGLYPLHFSTKISPIAHFESDMIQTLIKPEISTSTTGSSPEPVMRVLALAEGHTVHGPAKNLLTFSRVCQQSEGMDLVRLELAPFERSHEGLAPSLEPNEFLEEASRSGIPIHCIREGFRFDPRMIRSLRTLVAQVNPDFIQTHHAKSHFLVRMSGVWKKHPWIAFHHGHTRGAARLKIYHGLDRWSLRTAAQVVAVSGTCAQQLVSFGVRSDRITVIHNAVEPGMACDRLPPDRMRALKESLGVPADAKVVLAVGRLSEEKAHTDLVAAIASLRKLQPAAVFRLVILGEGDQRQRIEETIRSTGTQDVVMLTGHVRDVTPYYQISDVMAISSLSEGSPNVLLEAMAAGLPVVATAVGGIPEMITDQEHAILVPPRDTTAMANALDVVLSDRKKADRLAFAAYQLATTRYSPLQRARSLVSLYHSVRARWEAERPKNAQANR